MKPLFTITTDELIEIRSIYCKDINECKERYGNQALDYIMFLENEIHNINLELIKRGVR